jgi:hypothetical protein
MLKHLPKNSLDSFIFIMNNILNNQQIPSLWNSYKIIPIPKKNSYTSFRPIAISSSLCKIFEYMLKSRLDWWLESNSILSTNIFGNLGTTECLETFIDHTYHSFYNKQFFVTTLVDIHGAFDSVNIPTLISHLLSLHTPPKFCNILLSLFNRRNLIFFSPFGSYNIRSTLALYISNL